MGKDPNLPKEKEQSTIAVPTATVNADSLQKMESKQSVSLPPKIDRRNDPENWKKVFDQ